MAFPIRTTLLTSAAAIAAALLFLPADQAKAADSEGCEGGGYTISRLVGGGTVGQGSSIIPAASLGEAFLVQGRYNQILVVSASFGIRDWAFTGAPNPQDITGGRFTPVWASKTPDLGGDVLTSAVEVRNDGPDLVLERSGTGDTDMKIQAKDCATGGIFQMEAERGGDKPTVFTHILAPEVFYFDNPNFRAREGELVPFKDTFIPVRLRINIANDFSSKFVARDSAQVAERIDEPACPNQFFHNTGEIDIVLHCGGISKWEVASGGRMGFVTGQDAVEMAPSPTECVRKCQAQNRVRGRSTILGFPFPVPQEVRLQPRFPSSS
jgi:hypothetical protein